MNIKVYSLFTLAIVIFFTSCQGQSGSQVLNPESFEKKLNTASTKIVLDVRTQEEFNKGHLENAILVDYYKNDFKEKISKLDKDKPVFVYCAAGGRSGSASKLLTELGFKEVYDLKGGFNAWSTEKRPVKK